MTRVARGPPDSCQSRVLLLHQDFNLRKKFKMMDSDWFIRIKMDLNGFTLGLVTDRFRLIYLRFKRSKQVHARLDNL